MKIELDGNKMEVNIIGGFQLKEKDYVVCSYEDEKNNHKIVIMQVIEDKNGRHVIDILDSEKEEVIRAYQELKEKILEEEYE